MCAPLRALCMRSQIWSQVVAFVLTFLVSVMVHAARKSISSVAPLLKDSQFGYPTTFFGIMDLVFMLSYAIGMVFTTILGDMYNPLLVTLLAAALAGIFQIILGLLIVFLYAPSYYYLYYFINACIGVSQSPIWPALIKVMSNYLGTNHSGVLFGIWVTSSPVGNIVGANLASLMLIIFASNNKAVIPGTFIAAAILLVVTSSVTYLTVSHKPVSSPVEPQSASREKGRSESTLAFSGTSCDGSHVEQAGPVAPSDEGRVSFWRAWFIPGVIVYAIVTACVKGVAYALFFWLPLYLFEHASIDPMHANIMDTVYHVGGVIGSLACGWLSDRMVHVPGSGRAPALLLYQLLALITLSLMHAYEPTVAYLYVMLSLAGTFVGGAHAILVSAICTDLARQDALRGNREAISQVTGIIDGVGACGAAIQQGLISWIATYSWDGVFILLPTTLSLSCLLLVSRGFSETKAFIVYLRTPCST